MADNGLIITGCIIATVSENGYQSLDRHDFELCYSRRENNRIVASLVALKDGVIDAKLEPDEDGKDEAEAFVAFKMDMERRMNKLLESVPNVAGSPASNPADAPPAYDLVGKTLVGDEKS